MSIVGCRRSQGEPLLDGLAIRREGLPVQRVRLRADQDIFRLGRSPNCEVIVSHPRVGRYHASLERREGGYVLRDEGSDPGTFLNGQPVEQPMIVEPDQVITIGPYSLIIERPVQSPAGNTPYRVDSEDDFSGGAGLPATSGQAAGILSRPRRRSWRQIADHVASECRDRRWFLSRSEVRGLRDQAGGYDRAGDEMVEAMERFARMGRDRALEALSSWEPKAGTPSVAAIHEAISLLETHIDPLDGYGNLGTRYVIWQLRQEIAAEQRRA